MDALNANILTGNATNGADSATAARDAAMADLRSAADEVVGTVFYGTLLRQVRDSSLKGEYGHGGRGEEAFQAQLDDLFAKQAGKAHSTSISAAIVDRFGRSAAAHGEWHARQAAHIGDLQAEMRRINDSENAAAAKGGNLEVTGC